MTSSGLKWLLIIAALGLAPAPVICAGSGPGSKRILDENDPGRSRALRPRDAENMDFLERAIERIQDDQENLSAGKLAREQFDKSLAETKEKVAEVAAKNPGSAPVQTSAARAYTQAGDYEKAITHASRAMGLAPGDPFPITTRGMAYFKSKNYAQAARDAKQALAIDPGNPVAQALWKLSRDRASGTETAVSAPGAERALSRGNAASESLGAAQRHASQAMALPQSPYTAHAELKPDDDPEIARYKTAQGRRYARQVIAVEKALRRKDYMTVYGLANAALTSYADNPRVLASRMLAAWALGEQRTAAGDASLVLKANPDWSQALTIRASAHNAMGRHADALKDAEKAIALAPHADGLSYLERALAKESLGGQAESVLEDFKRAAELDSRYGADYQAALDRLRPRPPAQALAKTVKEASSPSQGSRDVLQGLLDRARKAEPADLWPAGALLVLAAAGFMLARRT